MVPSPGADPRFGMEATGGYEDALATHLHAAGRTVSVINPTRVKYAGVMRGRRNKTDKADARRIAAYTRDEAPPAWTPPTPEVRELQALVRRRDDLRRLAASEKVRLESPLLTPTARKSVARVVKLLGKEADAMQAAADAVIAATPTLAADAALRGSIPGVGAQTASTVLAELPPVARVPSAQAVAAYCGLSPREFTSGSSVRGRTRLSTSGNARLRKARSLPTLTAIRFNPVLKGFFDRLVAAGKAKMQAVGAYMRKLVAARDGVHRPEGRRDPGHAPKKPAVPDPDGRDPELRQHLPGEGVRGPAVQPRRRPGGDGPGRAERGAGGVDPVVRPGVHRGRRGRRGPVQEDARPARESHPDVGRHRGRRGHPPPAVRVGRHLGRGAEDGRGVRRVGVRARPGAGGGRPRHGEGAVPGRVPVPPVGAVGVRGKWATLPRFQRTRGILRLLALWVAHNHQDGHRKSTREPLVTLGMAPLENPVFRSALFEQLGSDALEGPVTTDIAGKADAHALRLDKEASDAVRKAQLHRKAAAAIRFESNGGMSRARAEAAVPEIRTAVFGLDTNMAELDEVLESLASTCFYLNWDKNRYRFGLTPNLNQMLVSRRGSVRPKAVDNRARAITARVFNKHTGK